MLVKADPNVTHVDLSYTDLLEISDIAFYECSQLTRIVLPIGLTTIGDGAFASCTRLASVTFPNRLTSIEDTAFRGCTSLTIVDLSQTRLTVIEDETFYGCTALATVIFPEGLTTIRQSAFAECGLTELVFPSLTSIGDNAFEDCTGLTIVDLSQSRLTIIEDGTFQGCTALASVSFPEGLTTIRECAFMECGFTELRFPNSLTSIGYEAFDGCANLIRIALPDGLTSVGRDAFFGTGLSSVNLPPTLLDIGEGAFDCRRIIEFDNLNDVTRYLLVIGLKPPPQTSQNDRATWDRVYRALMPDRDGTIHLRLGVYSVAIVKFGTHYTVITNSTYEVVENYTDQSTECPICLIPFAELPGKWTRECGHSLCIACAERLYGNSGPKPCPICRNPPLIDFGNKTKLRL